MNYGFGHRLNILIADDHHLVRQGIRALIVQANISNAIFDAEDGEQAWQCIHTLQPEIAILDISMGNMSGLEVCHKIKQRQLSTKVIFLSMHEDIKIINRAFAAGAHAYLPKSDAFNTLTQAIKHVCNGEQFISPRLKTKLEAYQLCAKDFILTAREQEIVTHISSGLTNREIAERLCISIKTVDNHRTRIMKKLGLNKTAELVRFAVKEGLVL
ncbi:hypothetical protein JF50_17050 [Pseudoalteromonas luteoviolacea]|uniref:Response regulator transcription factor n=1 Tax=Pseudoalteromonas luteoviolacea TaxID=43657 RepID=A0A0C1MNE4_9GAMM|nr:response regulator transcription factor [Pseudoalteromonas luteoviolacea]KID56023.1 hypothetical protein JF50_17050 [Pseudoalteromonas luteoviolacea]